MMTIGQWVALIRDGVILALLVSVLVLVYRAGANHNLQQQVQALQKQLENNSRQEAQWAEEVRDAQAQRVADMAQIGAAIAAHSAPIVVYRPAGGGTVPRPSPAAGDRPAEGGGPDAGSRVDVRPGISAFESKYEEEFAGCRELEAWARAVAGAPQH